MAKFRITYTLAGRPGRQEIVVNFASGASTARAVARAIIKHEFPDALPFGVGEVDTAEHALKRFRISEVKTSALEGS